MFDQDESKKTIFKFGGYIKANFLHTWYNNGDIGSENAWREFHLPNQMIPMGENDHNYDLDYHVKESRLNFHHNPYTGIINFLLNEKELTF